MTFLHSCDSSALKAPQFFFFKNMLWRKEELVHLLAPEETNEKLPAFQGWSYTPLSLTDKFDLLRSLYWEVIKAMFTLSRACSREHCSEAEQSHSVQATNKYNLAAIKQPWACVSKHNAKSKIICMCPGLGAATMNHFKI